MKHFVGIDLGTTNSAICSYNGEELHLWKSPRAGASQVIDFPEVRTWAR
jgi:molecular chaperone DnaK (HSP70)